MKALFKTMIAAAALALCASFASAEIGMYGRLDLGFAGRTVSEKAGGITMPTSIAAFDVMPAFGIMFAPNSDNVFMKGFGLEAQLDMNFGGSNVINVKRSAAVINPGVMAKWHYYLPESCPVAVQKIVPYVGLGFSIPISIVKTTAGEYSETLAKGGFDVNWNIGCGYEVLPKLMVTLDYGLSVGTSFANTISVGAVWKFSGIRKVGSEAAVGNSQSGKSSEAKSKKGKAAVEVIEAGSAKDPFKGTSWKSKGVTILEFKNDGTAKYGIQSATYEIKKEGERFTATLKLPMGVKGYLIIANADAAEAECKVGVGKVTCTRN